MRMEDQQGEERSNSMKQKKEKEDKRENVH